MLYINTKEAIIDVFMMILHGAYVVWSFKIGFNSAKEKIETLKTYKIKISLEDECITYLYCLLISVIVSVVLTLPSAIRYMEIDYQRMLTIFLLVATCSWCGALYAYSNAPNKTPR